ncbi:MAG: Lrp/AsnC family transcriptional regulator [Opitutales bacterium]|nr:Lrp/AsnC family transcriptional regulator [Opitutales bacterium]
MSDVLSLLREQETLSISQMAKILGLTESDVERQIEELKSQKVLLGWRPVFYPGKEESDAVRAVIEVKIAPERGGGFNRLAERISRFDQVESCYLMSGGYDLMVIVRGKNLARAAEFVSERLATIEGVLSTSTHFLLRSYKEQGFLLNGGDKDTGRPEVSA